MKQNETKNFKNLKSKAEKNFIKYCELSLKFWMKFAQLSSIFHGMNELLTKFRQYLTLFQSFQQYLALIFWTFTEFNKKICDFTKVDRIS
jgi:hypothetical protein